MLSAPSLRLPVAPLIDVSGGAVPATTLAALFVAYTMAAGHGDFIFIGIAALAGAVGGSLSLLVHELGHAGAARRIAGIRVVRIVLMPLGAATLLEGSYRSGSDQLRVAIAGPVASVGFAMGLFAGMALPAPLPLRWALFLLAFLNLGVALIAMLPMDPFDGYKILVGAAWTIVRSERKAGILIRRLGVGFVCLDVAATVVVLRERPLIGAVVAGVAVAFGIERRAARRGFLRLRSSR